MNAELARAEAAHQDLLLQIHRAALLLIHLLFAPAAMLIALMSPVPINLIGAVLLTSAALWLTGGWLDVIAARARAVDHWQRRLVQIELDGPEPARHFVAYKLASDPAAAELSPGELPARLVPPGGLTRWRYAVQLPLALLVLHGTTLLAAVWRASI